MKLIKTVLVLRLRSSNEIEERKMDQETQINFTLIFERVSEPLYYGPKGSGSATRQFMVPLDGLSNKERDAAIEVQKRFGSMPSKTVNIKVPANMPRFTQLARACPKNAIFSYFLPGHQRALRTLKSLMMAQSNRDDFFGYCCMTRDMPTINSTLWVYAVAGAILSRRDMRGFLLPPLFEVMPDMFISTGAIRQAQNMARIPMVDRQVIQLNEFTGHSKNPENKLSYFREDIGINSHHWHWHIIFPLEAPRGQRDQKGQLFYYMHHSMLARYEAERLSNGLPLTKILDLDEPIKEGYFSKLTSANSGNNWGTRQEGSIMRDIDRRDDPNSLFQFRIQKDEVKKFISRILDVIDSGSYLNTRNERVNLTWQNGTDILGDMIEASILTPNPQYYSEFGIHNWLHLLVAYAHDPEFKHREYFGPMAETATAMRDPVFYRVHKFIDNIFDLWKRNPRIHPPYQIDGTGDLPLVWNGIRITDVSVQTAEREANILVTEWMESDIDVNRGLDFMRTADNLGPVWVRITHLNHEEFEYRINVRNELRSSVSGTFRIFIAPRFNEQGARFSLVQQRLLFFEMDRFVENLNPGDNRVVRRSTDSAVTIPWQETFRLVENRNPATPTANDAICGCGWPNHMLLPKGTPDGMVFDLFVMITNAADDMTNAMRQNRERNCRESVAFCGILDQRYPDTKPMGYPFDREIRTEPNNIPADQRVPINFIENFMPMSSNGITRQFRIVHMNQTRIRPGGAPANQEVMQMPDNTASPSNPQPQVTRPPPSMGGGTPKPAPMKNGNKPNTQIQFPPRGNQAPPGRPGGAPGRPGHGSRPGGGGAHWNQWNSFGGHRRGRSPSPNSEEWEFPEGEDEQNHDLGDWDY